MLTAKGYKVNIVQSPMTTLRDDVVATKRVLDLQDGPSILVGHSYGGMVITEAGNADNVAGLVYIAAFQPDAGENLFDLAGKIPAATKGITATSDEFLYLDRRSTLQTSRRTCRPPTPNSWRIRRSSRPRRALKPGSRRPPGRPGRAGLWSRRKIAPYIQT